VPAAIAFTMIATRSAPEGLRGVAGGMLNTSQQLGAGLGLAMLVAFAGWRGQEASDAGAAELRILADVHGVVGAGAAVSLLGALAVAGLLADRG
jgi:hypothetical protein